MKNALQVAYGGSFLQDTVETNSISAFTCNSSVGLVELKAESMYSCSLAFQLHIIALPRQTPVEIARISKLQGVLVTAPVSTILKINNVAKSGN
jgi:hypothetical protein